MRLSRAEKQHQAMSEAFEVYQNLVIAEVGNPALRSNIRWQKLRISEYENFRRLYESALQ